MLKDNIRYAYEDDDWEPSHCGEPMDEYPQEHAAGIVAFKCIVCGKVQYFNAYTGVETAR